MALDQLLLERLSANTGNLLDDEELIGEHRTEPAGGTYVSQYTRTPKARYCNSCWSPTDYTRKGASNSPDTLIVPLLFGRTKD